MKPDIAHLCAFFIAIAPIATACEQGVAPGPAEPVATPDESSRDKSQKDRADHGAGEEVEIQTVPVAGNIYMLIGRGGNIGVSVGGDGILIIDDQFAPLADKIRAALGALSKGDLQYVLNTHHHGDHVGGNAVFGKEATIIAHDNVRKNLAGKPAEVLPVVTFDKTLTVHFNGEAIRAVHFASGHTDGDSIIFFDKSNVVHMGDHFFNGRFPYVDLGNGGNPAGLEENIRTVLGLVKSDTKIIPGHGPLATRDDLVAYHQMLIETVAVIRGQIKQGKNLAAIQKQGLPAKWKSWGEGFISTEKWIETIYNSSTAGK
ncbi:MAG: MBL fold metallo-hydrolase [Proteobacteria bacterium]|nr:MBL fold metallo-hydrolase [Pseudomonadota bacterium]